MLLKDDTVVAAAKEFPRGSGGRRATVVGEPYEPPPLPSPAAGDDPPSAFAALAGGGPGAREAAIRALRGSVPLLPRLLAESLVAEAAALPASPAALAARALERARALVAASDGEPVALGDVFVYADGGRIVQATWFPLQFAALEERRERRFSRSWARCSRSAAARAPRRRSLRAAACCERASSTGWRRSARSERRSSASETLPRAKPCAAPANRRPTMGQAPQ